MHVTLPSSAPTPCSPPAGRITCLIPTYNRRRLLARALASALLQDVPGLGVHVFDNHSTDGSGPWLKRVAAHRPGVVATIHSSNIGAYLNFKAAFASVHTPYFSILSDDDLLLPGFYRDALAFLEAHPDCGFYCGDTLHVTGTGAVRSSSNHNWNEGYHPPGKGYREIKRRGHPTWTGIVFRREIIDAVELLDDAGSPTDLDFELEAARRFGMYVSRRPAAVLTMTSITASSTKPLSWVHPAWEDFMRRHCHGFGRLRSREIAFLSDRYFADLLSVLNQSTLVTEDRRRIVGIMCAYRFWSGLGNRLVRVAVLHGGHAPGSRRLRLALIARKVLKLVEQPRLLLNILTLRRADRTLRRLTVFTW